MTAEIAAHARGIDRAPFCHTDGRRGRFLMVRFSLSRRALVRAVSFLTAAFLVTGTPGIWVYFPFLLVSGCLAGAFTGICAQLILRRFSGNANR